MSVSNKSFNPECKKSSFQVHRIDAHLGKQSHSSSLSRKPVLANVSASKSDVNVSVAPNETLQLEPLPQTKAITYFVARIFDGPVSIGLENSELN